MQTIAFPVSPQRRRLAVGGAAFLATDALIMGAVIWHLGDGRHLGLAIAFAAAGVAISSWLGWVLAQPPRAWIAEGTLHVEAGHRRWQVAITPERAAMITVDDLRDWPDSALPAGLLQRAAWRVGDALGWQASADGRRWFCALPGRVPAVQVPIAEGEAILLGTVDPEATAARLRAAAR